MADIKPIETVYNGYRFRSRLEARWAVFFDAAGIKYEYEPEGYTLNDGTMYLPDFFLPDFDIFVEIKRDRSSTEYNEWVKIANEWEDKCRKFRDSVGKAIYIQYGDPTSDMWGTLFAFDTNDEGGGNGEYCARFADIGDDDREPCIILCVGEFGKDKTIYVQESFKTNKRVCSLAMIMDYYYDYVQCMIHNRIMFHSYDSDAPSTGSFDWMRTKARQARFERGECG